MYKEYLLGCCCSLRAFLCFVLLDDLLDLFGNPVCNYAHLIGEVEAVCVAFRWLVVSVMYVIIRLLFVLVPLERRLCSLLFDIFYVIVSCIGKCIIERMKLYEHWTQSEG